MKNLNKHITMVALVAGGVLAAGYVMSQFNNVDVIKKAQDGFQGII